MDANMPLKEASMSECLPTSVTLVWLLLAMCEKMYPQMSSSYERLPAVLTCVQPLPTMSEKMSLQLLNRCHGPGCSVQVL